MYRFLGECSDCGIVKQNITIITLMILNKVNHGCNDNYIFIFFNFFWVCLNLVVLIVGLLLKWKKRFP